MTDLLGSTATLKKLKAGPLGMFNPSVGIKSGLAAKISASIRFFGTEVSHNYGL